MTAVLNRPVTAATLADRRPPLPRLVGLEIRKILSTRSGLARSPRPRSPR